MLFQYAFAGWPTLLRIRLVGLAVAIAHALSSFCRALLPKACWR